MRYLILIIVLLLTACSSGAKISPEFDNKTGRLIALLPNDAPSSIQREKSEAIRQAVIDRLKSKGLFVLEDSLVRRTCSSPACPEKEQLEKNYLVENYATLELESAYRTNFVAGVYSTIAGEFKLLDSNGKEIYSKECRQSKRGGLLFNSGQVIQGLVSQITADTNREFEGLSQKFARGLLKDIPKITKRGQIDDAILVGIDKIEIDKKKAPIYKVCALGSPTSEATLIINQTRTNLREVSSGRYCGIYRLESDSEDKLTIELRSPFGNSDRKEIGIPLSGATKKDFLNV